MRDARDPTGPVRRDAPVDLADALDAPTPELGRLLARLRSTITRLAHARRDAGTPLDRVVPEVRRLVREAAAREGWAEPTDAVTARVVHWAVVAYYSEPELAHVPRFY